MAAVEFVDVVVDKVFPEVCCGVLVMSLPLANTGVSGSEHDVCIPELVGGALVPISGVPMGLSPDGEVLVEVRRRDGPGRSVGRVRRSTGTSLLEFAGAVGVLRPLVYPASMDLVVSREVRWSFKSRAALWGGTRGRYSIARAGRVLWEP